MLARIFGSILIGLCLSGFGILMMTLILGLRNLPGILATLQRFIRFLFRGSYRLYNAVLSQPRVWIFQVTGYDIYQPILRVTCSVLLSLVIGAVLLVIFSLQPSLWVWIVLALHGLFVGLAWENILRSDDFQMGVNLE